MQINSKVSALHHLAEELVAGGDRDACDVRDRIRGARAWCAKWRVGWLTPPPSGPGWPRNYRLCSGSSSGCVALTSDAADRCSSRQAATAGRITVEAGAGTGRKTLLQRCYVSR